MTTVSTVGIVMDRTHCATAKNKILWQFYSCGIVKGTSKKS